MRQDTPLFDRLLTTRDSFQKAHAPLQRLVRLHVYEVRTRQAVLRDQNRLLIPLELGEQLGSVPLQGGNKLGSHIVILKYHLSVRKISSRRAPCVVQITRFASCRT